MGVAYGSPICMCVWESVRLHFASTCTYYWPWTGLTCSGQGMGGLSVCLSPRLFYLLGCGSQVQLSLACVHWVHWATALCYSDGLGMRALWLEDPPPFSWRDNFSDSGLVEGWIERRGSSNQAPNFHVVLIFCVVFVVVGV